MNLRCFCAVALTTIATALAAAQVAPEFFVFDNGVGRGQWTPEQQAATLKELGYAGISYNYTSPEDLAAWRKAFKKQGLKIYAIYLHTVVDEPQPFEPSFREAIKLLKGTDTVIWMTVKSPKVNGDYDAKAVKVIQEVADLAAAQGLRVSLYGHTKFYIADAADSARFVKLANRPNLGATINLCHEFYSHDGRRLDEIVNAVAPVATMASINGLDQAHTNYIMRLDQGDFDLPGYLTKLFTAGYRSPVGLQCYNVPGDIRTNLAANIATWCRIVGQVNEQSPAAPPQNLLTAKESAAGWKLLFDGRTTTGWRGFQSSEFPRSGWTIENGCLTCLGEHGGDIITTTIHTNFEFAWEWRLSFQANSGVKYFVSENRANQRGAIAHEYQTIDDHYFVAEPLNVKKLTGAWYDVMPAKNAHPSPVGEWNSSRLVVNGKTVEHWLNGKCVLSYRPASPEAAQAIANSKFKDVAGYADKIPTPILLQDHETKVWFRNLKIRELP